MENTGTGKKQVTDIKIGDELVHTGSANLYISKLIVTKITGKTLYYDIYDFQNKKITNYYGKLDLNFWRKVTKLEKALK